MFNNWGPYLGTCPHCGSNNIEADYSITLTSNPPQYNCRCKDCKGTFFSGQIKQPNLIIPDDITTPFTPPNIPFQPIQPDKYGMREGWICPRCGKVNSPDRDFCDCSSGGGWGSPIIWCNSEGTSAGKPNVMPSNAISGNTTASYSLEACNLHEKPNPPRIKPIVFTESFSLKEEKNYENKTLGDLN